MTKEQKLQVPAYIKDFLDKQDSLHHGLSEVFNTLQNIHMEWHDRYAYDEEEYADVLTALWVQKLMNGSGSYNNLFLFLADVYKYGYESKTIDKQFVVLSFSGTEYFDTEYLDKDFDEVDIVDAIKFNTKEEAEAFIVKHYTIKEVYADEN